MKSKFLIGSTVLLSAGAIAWAAKDPVVMTVNGVDVPKSEFEYLYHKNSQQQIDAQPLDEYIEMFELYKMKVADAKAEGIDTMSSFQSEMAQYRRELAMPYVADSVYLNKLIDESANFMQQEADYFLIMIPKGNNKAENDKYRQLADSVRAVLVAGADFEEVARKHSFDRSKDINGGHYGWRASGIQPYIIEKAVYSLTPGEISEVLDTSGGYYIFKGGDKRPSQGSVRAAHILKMARQNSSPEADEHARAEIDSIYQVLLSDPSSFESLAMQYSDDPGSARMGGQVGWFVVGQMVPEFSDKAFEMKVGEISEPVRTNFGYHIIKKIDARPPRTKDEIKPELLTQFNNPRDDHFKMIRDNRDKNLSKKHKVKINGDIRKSLDDYVSANGIDSVFYVTFGKSPKVLYTINGKPYTISNFVSTFKNAEVKDPYVAALVLEDRYESEFDNSLMNAEEDWLYANDADYRNLLNEYHDGSLLYEVSLRKVWDKASQDVPGLEKYFADHKSDYIFREPRVKGFLVQAKNDSVAAKIKERFPELDSENVLSTLRNEFRNEAVIDRLLIGEGGNRFVDYIMFNGVEPDANPKYPVYFIIDGRIITAPEEMNDVKGMVTSDYQQMLEQNWTTELRKKYPVVRNDKELKKIK